MTILEKILAVCVGAAFVGGLVIGRSGARSAISAETKSYSELKTQVAIASTAILKEQDRRDIVTTITKKTDGTAVTTVVDHSVIHAKITDQTNKSIDSNSKSATDTTKFYHQEPTWSLGLSYAPAYAIKGSPYSPTAFTPSIGYRLAGGIWLEAAFPIQTRSPTIGIRLEF